MTKVTEIALEERYGTSAVAEARVVRRRLTCQWYKDPSGALRMRWVSEVEQENRRLQDALAA